MIINNSSCTKKRKNKYNRKQTYCQYDFWKSSQIFPWRLKGFSRCDITALFLYYQQTKGALRSTWRLEWRIQGGTVNWWMSPTTHEGGLHVAALKSTNCLQICSVKTGCSVGGVGGHCGLKIPSSLSVRTAACSLFCVIFHTFNCSSASTWFPATWGNTSNPETRDRTPRKSSHLMPVNGFTDFKKKKPRPWSRKGQREAEVVHERWSAEQWLKQLH